MRRIHLWVITLALLGGGCATDDLVEDAATEDADRIVVIHMQDNHFEPDSLEVDRGETVAFRFINSGDVQHDAFIGDEQAQDEHEREARASDDAEHGEGHTADEKDAITVEPGETGILSYRFTESGETLIGCHEPGHYEDGMLVTVTVV